MFLYVKNVLRLYHQKTCSNYYLINLWKKCGLGWSDVVMMIFFLCLTFVAIMSSSRIWIHFYVKQCILILVYNDMQSDSIMMFKSVKYENK